MPEPRSIFIAGPTAVGKSTLALALAERLHGEIISVDSMQVYRGMDIGTAKQSAGERARVPHHLIDVADVTEPFDAARFRELAAQAERGIRARGKTPVFCGGTGLYFKAYLEGLGQAPPADRKIRDLLEKTPLEELLAELSRTDPMTYEKIDRQNPRRVIRAVEVIRATGKPFSEQRASWKNERLSPSGAVFIGLSRERDALNRRIEERVDAMFHQGLVEETRRLLDCGLAENKTALQALGYRQVVEHLRGERPLSETIELVKIRTRQFAKRQMTWFRRQMALEWVNCDEPDAADELLENLSCSD